MRDARLVDDPLAAIEIEQAGFGQFDPPRRSGEQPQPDRLLEQRDPPREGRGRHADSIGRAPETARLGDFDKQRHVVEVVHKRSIIGIINSIMTDLSC
jgi:hypothetical protein